MRRATVVTGAALVVVAFAAATRVADTREGLIAEVVTLLAGMAAVGLLIYGLASRPGPGQGPPALRLPSSNRPRTARDLFLGAGGVALSAVLVTGLALSGGPLSAAFGFVLLLPMIAACVYLCVRFLRASS